MSLQGPKTTKLFKKAKAVMPYGVNSNFRYWGDDDTLIATRGEGAYIWDADGNRSIDYRLGFGPIILGHGYPAVVKRVLSLPGQHPMKSISASASRECATWKRCV